MQQISGFGTGWFSSMTTMFALVTCKAASRRLAPSRRRSPPFVPPFFAHFFRQTSFWLLFSAILSRNHFFVLRLA